MATHSSLLAWRIPGTEEPGGLLSMGSHRVWHDWSDLGAAAGNIVYILRLKYDSLQFINHSPLGIFYWFRFLFSTTSKSVLSVHLFC